MRRELRRAQRELRTTIFAASALAAEHELEQIELAPVPTSGPAKGSRPQWVLSDPEDRRYLFKLAPPEQIAAECFAGRVHALAGRVHVPTARRRLSLPGLGEVVGMVQPRLPIVGPLDPDPLRWSKLQREAIVQDHPWEWLLANLDTHVDQYVLVGEHHLPINIDWDHALVDLDQTSLTRFNRRSATVAPIRNLLYAEYVLARVGLDFYGMQLQARKAAELPDEAIAELVDRYARELALPEPRRLDLRARVLRRKASLVSDFDALVESLRHEREEALGLATNRRSRLTRTAAHVQDAWQRVAITVLHPHVVRPVLRGYRGALAAIARLRRG